MKIELKQSKIVNSLNTDVVVGSFAFDSQPLQFENCRERFASTFNANTTGFYFKHSPEKGESIANFIVKTECVLGNLVFSEFAQTNRDSILWVSPNMFWKQCPMRRSLFTILLRAGNSYNLDLDNYEEALFSNEYIDKTKKAFIRFMMGFTQYVGPDIVTTGTVWFKGWKSVFEDKNELEIKKMLVSSSFKNIDEFCNFKDSLFI